LTRVPPAGGGQQLPGTFATGAQALAAWLDAAQDPEAASEPAVVVALGDASKRLSADCKAGRARTLEDLGLQRTAAAAPRPVLATLAWADSALYHAWRLAESLRIASGR